MSLLYLIRISPTLPSLDSLQYDSLLQIGVSFYDFSVTLQSLLVFVVFRYMYV